MNGSEFDEVAFFHAITVSGARALLIGRRALVALGLPLLTAEYDFWLHIEDIAIFNRACEPFELHPNRTPEEARSKGRYVLENDERVDVLVARTVSTTDGQNVAFDDLWPRRVECPVAAGTSVCLPSLDDLILTKRFGNRPRDLEDIRQLLAFKERTP